MSIGKGQKKGVGQNKKNFSLLDEKMMNILGDELQSLDNKFDSASDYIDPQDFFTIRANTPANNPFLDDREIEIIPHPQKLSQSPSV